LSGPTPEQLRVFGLKHTAARLAKQHGVPMLEGNRTAGRLATALNRCRTLGRLTRDAESTAAAAGSACGVCWSAGELSEAFEKR